MKRFDKQTHEKNNILINGNPNLKPQKIISKFHDIPKIPWPVGTLKFSIHFLNFTIKVGNIMQTPYINTYINWQYKCWQYKYTLHINNIRYSQLYHITCYEFITIIKIETYLCIKTIFMPKALAMAQACWPPAPPKHASTCSDVSWPLAC